MTPPTAQRPPPSACGPRPAPAFRAAVPRPLRETGDRWQPSLKRHACCAASLLLLAVSSVLLVLGGDGADPGGHGALRQTLEDVQVSFREGLLQVDLAQIWRLWSLASFPNPWLNPKTCGLKGPGPMCDPDHLIANASRWAIQDRLQRLNNDLPYTIGVAVMDRFDVSPYTWDSEHALDAFADGLLGHWKLGDGHSGVMMVMTREPARVTIYSQRKARHRGLDPNLCSVISEYGVQTYVEDGHLDRGIVSGVEEIAVALRHPPEPMRPWMSDKLFRMCCVVAGLAVIICFGGCCCRAEGVEEDEQVLPAQTRLRGSAAATSPHAPPRPELGGGSLGGRRAPPELQ